MVGETLFDTIKRAVGRKQSIDIDVTICPDDKQDELIDACEGDPAERWLFAGTPSGSEIVWLMGGEADEPMTDDAPERRVFDAINHETMHAVISFIEDEDTSDQYDDFIRGVLPVTTYLHRYAQFSEIEDEIAQYDESRTQEVRA